jgi:hypothetical protein
VGDSPVVPTGTRPSIAGGDLLADQPAQRLFVQRSSAERSDERGDDSREHGR